MRRPLYTVALLSATCLVTGCGGLQRLADGGGTPSMTMVSDPTRAADYRPITMPMPNPEPAIAGPDSLWRAGSRAFFKDQRASQVGDIVTVTVNIVDQAQLNNNTKATRTSSQSLGAPNLFGLETALNKALPKGVDLTTLLSTNSADATNGTGNIARNETVQLRVAGTITQVLPNGNLVISAHQEVRVNSELRELLISGVIRPQDIASDNTVPHDRLAEARISYGGRGVLTDENTPHYGQSILNTLSPF
jgi:flagellar L-ring protein precursor FlgH